MNRRQSGFSLLEAIVALVIFSMVAMALYGWQSANLHTLRRAEAHARQNALSRSALSLLAQVNPMLTPSGERPLGPLRVQWLAHLLQPAKPGVSAVGVPDLFELGLYRMDVRVLDGSRLVTAFHVRQVGFKQIHAMDNH